MGIYIYNAAMGENRGEQREELLQSRTSIPVKKNVSTPNVNMGNRKDDGF